MKALLVIDMQLGSFRPYDLRFDTLGVVGRINLLAEQFRRDGDAVVFVMHNGSKEGDFIPGSDDWGLLPELVKAENDVVMEKTANDAFYATRLGEWLADRNITEVFIVGCATDYCVDTTVKSAIHKDLKVVVVSDAHTTADRQDIKAQQVIRQYNTLWDDMLPAKYKAVVRTTEQVLADTQ
jgi:nicotinamidase-related amidase